MPKRRQKYSLRARFIHPHAQEMEYYRALQPLADLCFKAMIDTYWHALYLHPAGKDTAIHDALTVKGSTLLSRKAEREVFKVWSDKDIERMASKAADNISAAHKRQFTRKLAKVLEIKPYILDKSEAEVEKIKEGFIVENVELIKSIPNYYFQAIEGWVTKAGNEGWTAARLANDLKESFDLSRNKAKLIARDQTGKLFGQLNKERQTAAGIRKFVWRTMEDERVREEHEALDGQEFSWDDPPDEGMPGEPIQCRCTAEAVLEGDE